MPKFCNSHRFESASANAVNVQSGSESGNEKTPTNEYDPETGVLALLLLLMVYPQVTLSL